MMTPLLAVFSFLCCAVGSPMSAMPPMNSGAVDAQEAGSIDSGSLTAQAGMPASELPGTWMHSFEEAAQLAAVQQVPLIVHFEASWCGPCRQMDANVLNQPAVLRQLTRYFVGVRVDADRHPELISRFLVASLPTEVILSPEGKEIGRFTGIATLDSYVRRLQGKASEADGDIAAGEASGAKDEGDQKLRSCLLVQHDGKTVGLGGYSPVALVTGKVWEKGSDQIVAAFEGVDYFFRSAAERDQFLKSPQDYVPRLHGCDPVAMFRENRAAAGAIEYGAFYKGQLYFFSSLKNRQRFQSNPDWYAAGSTAASVQNPEKFPFLSAETSLE